MEVDTARLQPSNLSDGIGGERQVWLCTVLKMCLIFLVSLNGAEFPMRNQRRTASPPNTVNCTVRKYLTAREIEKLMDHARQHNRYGHRGATMILVTYRHGLRASEVCDLQWHQVELDQGRMHVRRAKSGTPSAHPIRGDEVRVPYASSAARARPRFTSSPSDAADVAGLGPASRAPPPLGHPPPPGAQF